MPLIPPALDDRSYDDLVQEMLSSIPAHTPEWTNPQPGDPGRTMVELFAWLADTILYRANLVPEKQRIAFLRLLGQQMQPAGAATGLIALSLNPASTTPLGIAAPSRVTGPVPFETLTEIDLLPVTGQAYIKAPLSADQQASALPLLTGLKKLYSLPNIPSGYSTAPLFANGQGDTQGVDLTSGTTDGSLWLALLAAKPENVAAIVDAIGGKNGQQILNVGFVPSIAVPGLFSDLGAPASVQPAWQMTQPYVAGQPVGYTNLKVFADTTQGLTQAGVVRLLVPPSGVIGAPPNDVRADAQAGVGMKPPRLDDASVASRLVAWVRMAVKTPVKVSWAGVNAVDVDQRTTYRNIVIGVSDGSANQQFALPSAQIDPASFVLEVDMPGLGFRAWQAVDDVSVVRGPAPVYVLDAEAGTVALGNQLQGMIPPAGRRIRVSSMRAGGGAAGTLPAGSLTAIQAFDAAGVPIAQTITVQQPVATTGGKDAETLDDAQLRIPSLLRTQGRAVTASDYKTLAKQAPGGDAARVEVLPLFKPQTRTPNVPGVVSVMVVPGKEGVLNPCPRADRPMLERVYQYLNPRRPVAAEMYVIASEYVGLGISVAVEVKAGFELLQVSQAVETALRSYLWPIAPGGPDQGGWPLGRMVRSLELEVIVSQVPGVIEVNGLNLFTPLASGGFQKMAADGNCRSELTIASWQLPEVLEVTVTAGPDGSGVTAPDSLAPVQETDDSIAVPVVPAVC